MVPGQSQSQIIRLWSRVDEKAHTQRWGEVACQLLSIQHQIIVKEAWIGVQDTQLLTGNLSNLGMTVANCYLQQLKNHYYNNTYNKILFPQPTMRDIIDAIQVSLPLFVVHILALGRNNLQRVSFEKQLARRPLPSQNVHKSQTNNGKKTSQCNIYAICFSLRRIVSSLVNFSTASITQQ